MPGTDAQVNLSVKLDQAQAQQIAQFVDQTIDRFSRLDALMKSTGQSAGASGAAIIEATKQSQQATADLAQSYDQVGKAADGAGNIQISAFRSVGRALDQLGLSSIGRPVQKVGDIGIISKDIGQVTDALGAMGLGATELVPIIGAAAAGFVLVKGVLDAVAAASKPAVDGLQAVLDTQDEYYKDLGALTSKQAQDEIDKKQRANETLKKQQQENYDILYSAQKGDPNLQGKTGDEFVKAYEGLIKIGEPTQITEAVKKYDELGKKILDNGTLIERLTGDLGSNALVLNDDAAAAKATSAEVDKVVAAYLAGAKGRAEAQIKADADEITQQQKVTDEISTITYAGAEKRLSAINDEKIKNDLLIAQYEQMNDKTGAAAEAIKKLTDANAALDAEGQQIVAHLNDLPAELEARDKRLEDIQRKYNADTLAADDKSAAARAAIQKKLNDTLEANAQKYADTLAQDLLSLQQKQEDNLTSLNRDLTKEQVDAGNKTLDIQINAQRKAAQEAQAHADALHQIQVDAHNREFDLILANDFVGLLKSRRDTTQAITKENTSYNGKTAQEQRDEQNQLDDLARSLQRQRDARLLAYKQADEDAQKQYARSNAAALLAEQKADAAARKVRNEALAAEAKAAADAAAKRYKDYVAALKDANTFGQAYINVHAQIDAALLRQANATLSRINNLSHEMSRSTGSNMAHSAYGNYLGIGQASTVNELQGQRESFNGIMLPRGMGVFYPLQSGRVSPGGGQSLKIDNHFYGNNPQAIADAVDTRMQAVLEKHYAS